MKGYLRYELLLFGHCSHMGLQYQVLLSSVILEVFDEVEYSLNYLRNGISFQVFEPSCQQLNVQADENVYKQTLAIFNNACSMPIYP